MKKIFVLTVYLVVFGLTCSKAQTTATDFTENDCAGTSHHLFSELESGKVIVLVFVMPCSSCLGPALTAYNIVESFQGSNPGQVLYYLSDDIGTTLCSQIDGWATSNGIGSNRSSFSSPNINMNDYGIAGMPKVVVIGGGIQHKIYYNENDAAAGNSINIHSAISTALAETGLSDLSFSDKDFSLFIDYSNSIVKTSYSLNKSSRVNISMINSIGQEIKSVSFANQLPGTQSHDFNFEILTAGLYFINIKTSNGSYSRKFFIGK